MQISRLTLAAIAMLGASPFAAAAQQPAPQAPPAPPAAPAPAPARTYNLSRAERAVIEPLSAAVDASDWATATAALPAADAAARGADAKYAIAQLRLRIGLQTENLPLQARALDDILASGGALPTEMPTLYRAQFDLATQMGDRAKADQALARLIALNPNDPSALARAARVRAGANDAPGAIDMYQRAIRQAGAAADPEWRAQIARLAYAARLPGTAGYMREWLAAQPTQALWHDSLAILAQLSNADAPLKLDIYRLMRAAGAMTAEHDYIQLSESANSARAFGEVKAVLEEGVARNLFTTNAAYARERIALMSTRVAGDRASLAAERTAALAGSDAAVALRLADSYFGYGDYAPAAELYRAALQKGGDANLLNTRLGTALALAGNRVEAETAFRAVAGTRAELAQYWLLWLSQRG